MSFLSERNLNSSGAKSDYLSGKVANTRILTRIITYLKIVKKASRKEIYNNVYVDNSKIADSLNWLVNNKILSKEYETYKKIYLFELNEKWLKL